MPLVVPQPPPPRERPMIGVLPMQRFRSEQTIRAADPETEPEHVMPQSILAKASLFENKIKAERANQNFDSVEVTLALPRTKTCPTPPSTPKPPRRLNAEKKLLSQRVIFLNDQTNGNCKSVLADYVLV